MDWIQKMHGVGSVFFHIKNIGRPKNIISCIFPGRGYERFSLSSGRRFRSIYLSYDPSPGRIFGFVFSMFWFCRLPRFLGRLNYMSSFCAVGAMNARVDPQALISLESICLFSLVLLSPFTEERVLDRHHGTEETSSRFPQEGSPEEEVGQAPQEVQAPQ